MTTKLYRFGVDFGRMGDLEGLFLADESAVKALIGEVVYFGECLGKHSDIDLIIEEGMIVEVTDDQDFIRKCLFYFGGINTISGYNPFDYYDPDEVDIDDY